MDANGYAALVYGSGQGFMQAPSREQESISKKLKRHHDQNQLSSHDTTGLHPYFGYAVKSEPEMKEYFMPGYSLSSPELHFSPPSTSREPHQPVMATDVRLSKIQSLGRVNPLAAKLLEIEVLLAEQLMMLDYGEKVSHVYNPIDYAFLPHFEYYKKYCCSSADVVMVGMNPGPFGMAQSGVPFGDVKSVVNWLGIKESVGSPTKLHHKRPILGFDCKRTEVSGTRFWGYLREKFGDPQSFFQRCFVYNHCPLVFMGASGKNITPAQMPAAVQKKLNELCDDAMLESLRQFPNCKTLVGIGRFAQDRIKALCEKHHLPYAVEYLMHPSPRNPTANRHWLTLADESLQKIGILPSKSDEEIKRLEQVKRELF